MIAAKVQPSVTLALLEEVRQMRARGEDVASFAAGEPDFDTPEPIVEAAIADLKGGDTKYVATPGIPRLREAIAQDYRDRLGAPWVQAENVIVTAGAKQGIYLVLAGLLAAEDEVIVPAPYWVSYPHLVEAVHGKVCFLETQEKDKFFPTVEALEKVRTKKTRALIFSSPGNPTGCMISGPELKKIVAWCRQHQVTLIYDELYERLVLTADLHFCPLSFLSEAESEYVISVNAFSKSMSMTGWRLGYIVTHRENIAALSPLHGQMLTCLPGFLQNAAIQGLAGADHAVKEMVTIYKKRLEIMMQGLGEIPGVKALRPTGAFYVCLDVREILRKKKIPDDDAFAKKILQEQKVVIPSGTSMGMPGWLRLSFATSEEEIVKGLQRLKKFCS